MHQALEGIALGVAIVDGGLSQMASLCCIASFGASLPCGGVIAMVVGGISSPNSSWDNPIPPIPAGILNGVAAGMLTYTACVDMLSQAVVSPLGGRQLMVPKLLAAAVGVGLMAALAIVA